MRLDHLLSKGKVRAVVYCSVTEVTRKHLVAMRPGDTPVPIPNTKVKTWAADGTALETVWESRCPPDYKKEMKFLVHQFFIVTRPVEREKKVRL